MADTSARWHALFYTLLLAVNAALRFRGHPLVLCCASGRVCYDSGRHQWRRCGQDDCAPTNNVAIDNMESAAFFVQ